MSESESKVGIDPCDHDDEFTFLVRNHINWVYRLAKRKLGDANMADDAVQAVFLALWQKRNQLHSNARPIGGWLLRATHYACSDLRKMRRRQARRELRGASTLYNGGIDSEEEIEPKAQMLSVLDAAMNRLSRADRDILVAKYFESKTTRSIATELGISERAAEKRISRALGRLRRRVGLRGGPSRTPPLEQLLSAEAGGPPPRAARALLPAIRGERTRNAVVARVAKKILLHASHIRVIAAAVVLAALVPAVAFVATFTPGEAAPPFIPPKPSARPRVLAPAPLKIGVLSCVAYEALARHLFVSVARRSGKLLSGRRGSLQAFLMPARGVRRLLWVMAYRKEALLGNSLHWLPLASPPGQSSSPLYFLKTYFIGKPHAHRAINMFLWVARPTVLTYRNRAVVHLRFESRSVISFSRGTGRKNGLYAYPYHGTPGIQGGECLVLLKYLPIYKKGRWYSILVFDVERYPYQLLNTIHKFNRAGLYIHLGPAKLDRLAAAADAWRQYAASHPVSAMGAKNRWVKALPGGAEVTLQGISTGNWPLCEWSPGGGRPVGEGAVLPPGWMDATFRISVPAWHGWNCVLRSVPFPIGGTPTVGFDFGKWHVVGTAHPTPATGIGQPLLIPRDFSFMGHRFGVSFPIAPTPRRTIIDIFATARAGSMAGVALAVGAVLKNGRFIVPKPGTVAQLKLSLMRRFQTNPSTAIGEYGAESLSVRPALVKKYVWITRRRFWVRYRKFSRSPSIRPSVVFATERRLVQKMAVSSRSVNTHHGEIRVSRMTPAGLMVLLGRSIQNGNLKAMDRLLYARKPSDVRLLKEMIAYSFAKTAFWAVAERRFGIGQLDAAGLGNLIVGGQHVDLPSKWIISGTHATPRLPLGAGVFWPANGKPLGDLIEKHGRWFLDARLSNAQSRRLRKQLRLRTRGPVGRTDTAYLRIMGLMERGKIRDAYGLRDALWAALDVRSKPPRPPNK
jgi:RNA polymerase sigma factor (sigma-70 family)